MNRLASVLLLLCSTALPASAQDVEARGAHREQPQPIDFAAIPRTIGKLPELVSEKPLYGLFLFGRDGEHRVWAVLDKQAPEHQRYDVLYLDVDADGDLTEAGERFAAESVAAAAAAARNRSTFVIGKFTEPGGAKHAVVHEDFKITWTEASIRFSLQWRGKKVTMGCYGPERSTYAQLATTPAQAPVFVPGWDRPFQFEHWMSGTLQRGQSTDFKVFIGNRGDRTGAFTCVDDEFLPAAEFVEATLLYVDGNGKQQRVLAKLQERC